MIGHDFSCVVTDVATCAVPRLFVSLAIHSWASLSLLQVVS